VFQKYFLIWHLVPNLFLVSLTYLSNGIFVAVSYKKFHWEISCLNLKVSLYEKKQLWLDVFLNMSVIFSMASYNGSFQFKIESQCKPK